MDAVSKLKDKYLIEKYILLKIIRNNPKSTRYWLRSRLSKLGWNMYDQLFKNILEKLSKDSLVKLDLEKDYSYSISITEAGIKEITNLEMKIKTILFISG